MVPLTDDDPETGESDAESGGGDSETAGDPVADHSDDPDDDPVDDRIEEPADGKDADRESSGRAGGFLGNIKNARKQLGDAKDAFSTARGAGSLPTDEEGRVRLVCRRYEERRLAPLDDHGRPSCYEAGNDDCEECVEAVRDGSVETW